MKRVHQDRDEGDRDVPLGKGRARRTVPLRLVTLALMTAGLIALSVLIAVPFLHAITWGIALAIMAWPMHKVVKARVANPSGAAAVSTTIVLLLLVMPGVFAVYQIGREAEALGRETGTTPDEVMSRESLERAPGVSRVVDWMDRVNLDAEAEVRKMVQSFLPSTEGLTESSMAASVQFLVAMFILFYVFRDRGEFVQGLRQLLPLTRAESDRVFASAADSVYANLYATVVTGLIDSITGAFLFWSLGLPAPFLWGAVMFILSILPVVGAALVWLPVAMYLAVTGAWPSALAILTWGIITAIVVDYILYARLAGDRMRMHPVPALLAFLGGLAVFGLSGMILGPAIVAMTAALLDLWREGSNPQGSAMTDAA
jgi:predicted PurR-regulated permease PerM